ncbi:sugar ABC transporter permease [Serinibacter arcticus]|uniref:Sugar ABC transporter permease n=1 Tax=Serinibacter arcticus TaxID=1655435 RepID=A0A2U1ZR92_9MICO|nr:sugar ABC transporter permease [Serinibacter arcticus]PWD49507.1 sugar ABC transporter permease [Serinibacter arcticus]
MTSAPTPTAATVATTAVTKPSRRRGEDRGAPQDKVRGARWWREMSWRYLVGVIACVYAAIPILYIVSASLNPIGSVASTDLIPTTISFTNFEQLWSTPSRPFFRWAGNTVVVALVVVVAQLLCSCFAAYAFSRFRFKGRRAGLLSLLLVLMFPQILVTVALFQMFSVVGEVMPSVGLDTLPGYILIMLGGSLGQVYLIKGFFDTVPPELDEAAKIDGAGHFQVFVRILLPLLRSILVISGLLVFVGVVGEFLLASIFLRSTDIKTIAVGMQGVLAADKSNNLGWFAAGSVVIAVPIILLFQYLQRYIVGGITSGAVKG